MDMTSGTALPCGHCDACLLHEHAWAEAATAAPPQPAIPAL